jgi:hypothetical protein
MGQLGSDECRSFILFGLNLTSHCSDHFDRLLKSISVVSSANSLHKPKNKIIEKASKQLNVLRQLKCKLDREYLERIYLTFILPILEYSCEVWDNCGQMNADGLEKINLEAARIITGMYVKE